MTSTTFASATILLRARKDAVRIAVNAGIDMSMVPSSWDFCIYLRELVEEGQVSMERIDDAVSRVLRLKFRLGLFEKPFWDTGDFPEFASDEYAGRGIAGCRESEILLKNEDGLLPLERSARILLTGPNANSMRCLNGGWSYSWQGDRCDEFAGDYNTIYEALCNKFDHVDYVPGVEYAPSRYDNWQEECVTGIDKAVSAAAGADVIIACIGENSYCETPGNMDDLNLSQNQKELVRALAATGKPLVLILQKAGPRVIGDIEPLAPGRGRHPAAGQLRRRCPGRPACGGCKFQRPIAVHLSAHGRRIGDLRLQALREYGRHGGRIQLRCCDGCAVAVRAWAELYGICI